MPFGGKRSKSSSPMAIQQQESRYLILLVFTLAKANKWGAACPDTQCHATLLCCIRRGRHCGLHGCPMIKNPSEKGGKMT